MQFSCGIFAFRKGEEMKSGSLLYWWSTLGILATLRDGDFALAGLWILSVFAVGRWLGWVAFKGFRVGQYQVFVLLHPPFVGIFPERRLKPRTIHFFGEENRVLMAFGRLPIHVLKG